MSEKIYLGTGKIHTFNGGGSKIAFAMLIDDLEKHLAKLKSEGENWIRIDICERKEPNEKGQTHYGLLNTWKPDSSKASKPTSAVVTHVSNDDSFDDEPIPF